MSIWNKVLEQIEQKLSAPSYETWLKNTVLLPFDEDTDTLIITTENEFGRDWLESRYAELISQTLFEITGKYYKLRFVAQITCASNELALVQNTLQNKRLNPGEDKLELIQRQLDERTSDIDELNTRLFKMESMIEQLTSK